MSAQKFPTTQWTLIVSPAAGDGTEAQNALAELCRLYWYPVYSFVRARSESAEEAQDLTQEFFLQLLGKNILKTADRSVGRFRCYLIASLKYFLSDQADRRSAQKRGGSLTISIDLSGAETRFARDFATYDTPERAFDRQWAVTVVAQACEQLQEMMTHEGRQATFHRLRAYLPGGSAPSSYAALATDLGMSENSVKVAIHRLRRRYRELLRANVSQTLADPEDLDDEIRFLLNAFSA